MVTLKKVSWSNFKDNQTFFKLCHARQCFMIQYVMFINYLQVSAQNTILVEILFNRTSEQIVLSLHKIHVQVHIHQQMRISVSLYNFLIFFFNCNVVEQRCQQLQLVLLILITFTVIRVRWNHNSVTKFSLDLIWYITGNHFHNSNEPLLTLLKLQSFFLHQHDSTRNSVINVDLI